MPLLFVHLSFKQGKVWQFTYTKFIIVDWRLTILARDASVALILPTIQFLIAYSIQKQRGKAWSIFDMNGAVQCLPTLVNNGFHFTNIWNSNVIGRYKEKLPSHSFCWWPIRTLCLPRYRHWHHSRDKMDKAFPVFAYYKRSKLDGGKAWECG